MKLLLPLLLALLPAYPQQLGQWFVMNGPDQNGNYAGVAADQPANVAVTPGLLTITASYSAAGFQSGNAAKALATFHYPSGYIVSNTLSATYGVLTYTATLPAHIGSGSWPAVPWLLRSDCRASFKTGASGPSQCSVGTGYQEIDPTEGIARAGSGVNQEVYFNTSSQFCSAAYPSGNAQQQHKYAMDWEVSSITFYIDDTVTCTITSSQIGIPNQPMFLLIDISVGGAAGGTPTPANFPVSMSMGPIHWCPAGTIITTCENDATKATVFDEEWPAAGPLQSVYVGQGFSGNSTGLDTGNTFGVLNNQQVSWPNDPGYCTNGQIGPGTTLNFVGTITTTLIANCSGTSGSPITYNFLAGSSGTVNTNGQSFINVVGPPSTSISGGITVSGNVAIH